MTAPLDKGSRLRRTVRPARKPGVVLLLATVLVAGGACGNNDERVQDGECQAGPDESITIAYQPGLGYGNLRIVQAEQMLEKELPDVSIEWRELNSGSAIRDGVLSGDIQVAAGGIGPFIIGRSAGMEWKAIASLNHMNLQLMTTNPDVETLADLQEIEGHIAMPGPDSIQSVVLRKVADEQLGDARALDSQILAMGHPDGLQALVAEQIDAHLTSPPFQHQENQRGARVVADSYDFFGAHTFNGVYVTEDFSTCNPDFSPAIINALQSVNEQIKEDPDAASATMADELGMEQDEVRQLLDDDGIEFTLNPRGFEDFAAFMKEAGLIRADMTSSDMFFENEATKEGT